MRVSPVIPGWQVTAFPGSDQFLGMVFYKIFIFGNAPFRRTPEKTPGVL
jgi:hypothetical protein